MILQLACHAHLHLLHSQLETLLVSPSLFIQFVSIFTSVEHCCCFMPQFSLPPHVFLLDASPCDLSASSGSVAATTPLCFIVLKLNQFIFELLVLDLYSWVQSLFPLWQ